MRPELWREIEGELRFFLRQQGERPQMLAEASLREHHGDRDVHLRLVLVDGTDWNVVLNGERFAYYGAGDARLFSRDCVRLYSQLYEDHLLEVQLRASWEGVDQLLRLGAPAYAIDQARREHDIFERQLRQHHPIRRNNSLMPLETYTDQAPGPENTLTLETMRRAMRRLRMPTDRELLYDFRPGGIGWVEQVGDFGVAYGGTFAASEVGGPQAQARALELLKANLSPQQLDQYEREKAFEVVGSATGKRYRIRHGRQMNIDELDSKGEKVCGWCFLPQGGLAAGDVMLGQKIALECDEEAALKVANRFGSEMLTLNEVAARYVPLPGAQARFFGVDWAS